MTAPTSLRRMAHQGDVHPWVIAAAGGADLPLQSDDPAEGVVLARYVDDLCVALLWVYPWDGEEEGPEHEPFEHQIDVYERTPDGSLTHAGEGGSDWDFAPGTRPSTAFWL